jgi:hypothetical protein
MDGQMSANKEFEPINDQATFDERIKARLAREREKWEKESGSADLKAELQSKDEEIAQIRREHYRAEARTQRGRKSLLRKRQEATRQRLQGHAGVAEIRTRRW